MQKIITNNRYISSKPKLIYRKKMKYKLIKITLKERMSLKIKMHLLSLNKK